MYRGNTSRQRMINLMYIVFIAMMGLGIHQDQENTSRNKESQQQFSNTILDSTTTDKISFPILPDQYVARAITPSRTIVRGTDYKADFALILQPTKGQTKVVVDGAELKSSEMIHNTQNNSLGKQQYSGYIEYTDQQGKTNIYPFEETYQIIEPQISLASKSSNIIYAGIDNELSISISGIPNETIHLSSDKAILKRNGQNWLIRPLLNKGEVEIDLSARQDNGDLLYIGQRKLPIRALPSPTPYLLIQEEGTTEHFKGGSLSKRKLLNVLDLKASVDDGILNLEYKVESFQIITFDGLGNAIPENSSNSLFTERQKQLIQNSTQGKRLYITEIIARGNDGVRHRIPSIEIILR